MSLIDRIRKQLRDIPASIFLITGLALTFFLFFNGLSIINAIDYEKEMERKENYDFTANISVISPFSEGEYSVNGTQETIMRDEDFDAEVEFDKIISICKSYKGNCYVVVDLEGENKTLLLGKIYIAFNEEKVIELEDGSYKTLGGDMPEMNGIYIYEGMKSDVHNIDGKDSFMVNNEYLEVDGMIKDYSMAKEVEGVVMTWDNIGDYSMDIIKKYQKRFIADGSGVQIIFESNLSTAKEDFDEVCKSFVDSGFELVDINEYLKSINEDSEYSVFEEASFVLTLVLAGFALVNCMYISNLWIDRRTDEIMIRKANGGSIWEIFKILFKDILKFALYAMIIACLMQLVYGYIIKRDGTLITFSFEDVALIGAGLLLTSMMSLIVPIIKAARIMPATGIKDV